MPFVVIVFITSSIKSVLLSNLGKTCGILYHAINAVFPCLCLTNYFPYLCTFLEITLTKSYAAFYPLEQAAYPKVNLYASHLLRIYIPDSTNLCISITRLYDFEQELKDFDTCNTYTGYYTFTALI